MLHIFLVISGSFGIQKGNKLGMILYLKGLDQMSQTFALFIASTHPQAFRQIKSKSDWVHVCPKSLLLQSCHSNYATKETSKCQLNHQHKILLNSRKNQACLGTFSVDFTVCLLAKGANKPKADFSLIVSFAPTLSLPLQIGQER